MALCIPLFCICFNQYNSCYCSIPLLLCYTLLMPTHKFCRLLLILLLVLKEGVKGILVEAALPDS